ncbi:acetyl-CoA C-acyltransferase family protein [Herbaspirillum sp. YR522]|uniref:acetyl-CoA C-acyltransferase family protein n=1 Tax=Herbaspirillum sp. YR522 TaxID=1144342 RepID=UPI00026FAB7C|nr:acetyl-CoA C-acyltransferase family protein [Herbaspirillum sp. YR522]EJM95981.1 acetyl-CoA acetyltransferase [Herbaspirillum sp. YR522]
MNEVFVVSAVRTAIGDFGGSLRDVAPARLATSVTAEAVRRSGIAADAIGHVVFGQVIPTEPNDAYLARIAALNAGLPQSVPAMTLNRLCGSGLQAALSAAQAIMLGDTDIALAGGAESMSRAPFLSNSMRWGSRMGDAVLLDGLTGALTDPFHKILMGVTAENVAQRHDISRAEQDALALESHRRAAAAIAQGRFKEQILPLEVKAKGKASVFDQDEHVRADVSAEELAGLRTLFKKEGGSVTAGNASGINDGAAALVLASGNAVREHGLRPLARLVSYAHAGVDPAYMGIGPVPATRQALQRAGLRVADLDVIESNEAFAAQACAVSGLLDLDPQKVNPNGSGISLGHPVGATGAVNTVKLVYEMQRRNARYGLVTMCIGGGQGIAAIFERM